MKTKKISRIDIIIFFCLFYPILPVYAKIASINLRNLLCLIFVAVSLFYIGRNVSLPSKNIWTSVCFLIWIIGRSIQDISSGFFLEGFYFLLLTIVSFICLYNLIKNHNDFLIALKTILIGASLVSILGIFEEITRVNVFLFLNTDYELIYNPLRFGLLRILGFSQHTIAHGVYVMFMMSICMYMWQFVNKKTEKFFIITIYSLLCINLLLTLSRSIIICTIASQFLILYMMGARKLFKMIFKTIIFIIPILFIVTLFIPALGKTIKYGFLMIAALFDSKVASSISSAFGNDNLMGVGNRFDLYGWVSEKMAGHWLFGHGLYADFSYSFTQSNGFYSWIQTKDSIEVEYLNTLYQFGIFGMMTEVLSFLSVLGLNIKKYSSKLFFEKKISFNKIAFVTLIFYYLQLFAVNQSSDKYVFYIFVMFTIIYNGRVAQEK